MTLFIFYLLPIIFGIKQSVSNFLPFIMLNIEPGRNVFLATICRKPVSSRKTRFTFRLRCRAQKGKTGLLALVRCMSVCHLFSIFFYSQGNQHSKGNYLLAHLESWYLARSKIIWLYRIKPNSNSYAIYCPRRRMFCDYKFCYFDDLFRFTQQQH